MSKLSNQSMMKWICLQAKKEKTEHVINGRDEEAPRSHQRLEPAQPKNQAPKTTLSLF